MHQTLNPQEFQTKLTNWVASNRQWIVQTLTNHVAIPSVAFDGHDRAHLNDSADFVAGQLEELGFTDLHRITMPINEHQEGGPAVIARRPAAEGYPTVMLYAHHDVQPVGEESEWETPPWQATEIDGRLYGRGTADDKAGIMVHLSVVKALLEILGDDLKVGITMFIEGEEEIGSPTFRNLLETHRDLLTADVIVIADSSNWDVGVPALTTSLRGMVGGNITVQVAEHAVHSGMFGGPLLDAPTVLAKVIAQLHDEQGNVAIPGLEQHQYSQVDYPEEEFRSQAGVLDSVRLAGEGSLADRLWNKPALSITGNDVPALHMASNTLIPQATAKFSLRLGPGMDPDKALESVTSYIENIDIGGAKITVEPEETGQPFMADTSRPAARLMLEALRSTWDKEPVEMGIGGSIPFTADLAEVFPDAEILITAVEDPHTKAHSANESLHLGDFFKSIIAHGLLLAGISSTGNE